MFPFIQHFFFSRKRNMHHLDYSDECGTNHAAGWPILMVEMRSATYEMTNNIGIAEPNPERPQFEDCLPDRTSPWLCMPHTSGHTRAVFQKGR